MGEEKSRHHGSFPQGGLPLPLLPPGLPLPLLPPSTNSLEGPAAGGGARQRHEGFSHTATIGTRPTQSTKVRHTPRRSVPRYVSPFVGARYPVQSPVRASGAGWTAQAFLFPGTSLPSPGVRRTFHHPGNVRVLEVKIYYFLPPTHLKKEFNKRTLSTKKKVLGRARY